MASATFDTHRAVKALIGAGIGEREAEAITDIVRDAVAEGMAARAGLAGLEVRLTRLVLGTAVAIVAANAALTVALLKLL